MSKQWKPGDLALWAGYNGKPMVVFRHRDLAGNDEWMSAVEGCAYPRNDGTELRPLLVIDLEDREQVKRLYDVLDAGAFDARWHENLIGFTAALRRFAEPEPDEPKLLGAVVECDDGSTFVRSHHNVNGWVRSGFGEAWTWSDLPRPLTVLSPGYTGGDPDAS